MEAAFCLPVLFTIMWGLWEVGRMTEVQRTSCGNSRRAKRPAMPPWGHGPLCCKVAQNLQQYAPGYAELILAFGTYGSSHTITASTSP